MSQCTCRCVVLPDYDLMSTLLGVEMSQCTCRCVVLPDAAVAAVAGVIAGVSMHLQVRGAP